MALIQVFKSLLVQLFPKYFFSVCDTPSCNNGSGFLTEKNGGKKIFDPSVGRYIQVAHATFIPSEQDKKEYEELLLEMETSSALTIAAATILYGLVML